MSKLGERIAKLEQAKPQGFLNFTKLDDGTYLKWTQADGSDYRYALNGCAPHGTAPELIYTEQGIKDLERKGWQIIVVEYIDGWRGDKAREAENV